MIPGKTRNHGTQESFKMLRFLVECVYLPLKITQFLKEPILSLLNN